MWMPTLGRFDQPARAPSDLSAALPVATAFLGSEQPSKDAVSVDVATVTRSWPALVNATLTIAASPNTAQGW